MSSKLLKKKPYIFTVGLKDSKSAAVSRLCAELDITYIRLSESDRCRKVGEIAECEEPKPMVSNVSAVKPGQAPEVLIFSNLTESKLDDFLAEYRRAGIESIALKAVVTAHNAGWTIDELTAELIKERAAMIFSKRQ